MDESSNECCPDILDVDVETRASTRIGPGCSRRDLPSGPGVRVWVVDIEPGFEWPYTDRHDATGEYAYVVSGELIEGDRCYGPGTYVFFAPFSRHRPRSTRGVRLFGFNYSIGAQRST